MWRSLFLCAVGKGLYSVGMHFKGCLSVYLDHQISALHMKVSILCHTRDNYFAFFGQEITQEKELQEHA